MALGYLDGDGCSSTCQNQPLACVSSDGDLGAYWKLDETTGTVASDSSGNGNHATLANGVTHDAGVPPALGFYNPGSDLFSAASSQTFSASDSPSLDLATAGTVSFWFKLDAPGSAVNVSKWDAGTNQRSYVLQVHTDGRVYWNLSGDGVSHTYFMSNETVTDTNWHHLLGTYDGATMSAYLDGTALTGGVTGAVPASIFDSTQPVANTYGGGNFNGGNLDDIRIYHRAFTLDEVLDLYAGDCEAAPVLGVCGDGIVQSGIGEQCDDSNTVNGDGCSNSCQNELAACITTDDFLVGHWEFNAGTGTVAFDAASPNNEGTVDGAAWVTGPVTSFYNPFALSFDGTDDLVNVGDTTDLNISNIFTVSAWVRSQGPSDYGIIAGTTDAGDLNGYYITINQATGYPTVYSLQNPSYQSAVVATNILGDDDWHHLAGVFDGTNLTMYLDGTPGTPVAASAPTTNLFSFRMGASHYPGRFFTGDIDDVRVYNKNLDGTQVSALAGGACDAGVIAPPPALDTDGDGIADATDNCVFTINPDQFDGNTNGVGDACEAPPTFSLLSDDEEDGNQGNGSRRGKRTNVLGSLVGLFGGQDDGGDIPPGGFGGPGEEEFTAAETELICKIRKAIPDDVRTSAVLEWVADELASKMPHSAEAILAELESGSICPEPVAKKVVGQKPVAFHVDVSGYPVSSNDTWNKCIRGTATLEDIRNNPDRDEDGFGYSCSRYHTSTTWRHPDLGVYFTWKKLTKGVTLPAGYALKKDTALTQK